MGIAVVENSGSLPLSNKTFKRGDDLTLLLRGGTEFVVELELDRTVFRKISDVLLETTVDVLLTLRLLAALNVTLVIVEDVVVIPLTVGWLSLC